LSYPPLLEYLEISTALLLVLAPSPLEPVIARDVLIKLIVASFVPLIIHKKTCLPLTSIRALLVLGLKQTQERYKLHFVCSVLPY
jgi:hypothetical protein